MLGKSGSRKSQESLDKRGDKGPLLFADLPYRHLADSTNTADRSPVPMHFENASLMIESHKLFPQQIILRKSDSPSRSYRIPSPII